MTGCTGDGDHGPGAGDLLPVYMAPQCGCQRLRVYRSAGAVPVLTVSDTATQLHFDVSAMDADDALWWVQCLIGGLQVWDEFLRRHYAETEQIARRTAAAVEVHDEQRHGDGAARNPRESSEPEAGETEAFFRSWDERFGGPFSTGPAQPEGGDIPDSSDTSDTVETSAEEDGRDGGDG